MLWRIPVVAALGVVSALAPALAGTLQNLVHAAPEVVNVSYQLTDGRVFVQGRSDTRFYILKPDQNGSYVNGAWKRASALPSGYAPYAFSGAVLADGRVIVQGGEYNFGTFAFTNKGYVYDPAADRWTRLSPPPGMPYIGDSSNVVLPDGRYVVAQKFTQRLAALDPTTMTWSELGHTGHNGFNSEEGLTLLRDGSLLVVNVKGTPGAQRWFPGDQTWRNVGPTPVPLTSPGDGQCIPYGNGHCYYPPGEVGPAILRPSGTVFATGALPASGPAHTAIYNPLTNSWRRGPDFPGGDSAGDNFAVLLPSGHVLVQGNSGFPYEFDGTHLIPQSVCTCGNSLMLLPTGGVLVGGIAVYRGTGTYQSLWRPLITRVPSSVDRGSTYQIFGKRFNGLSQANAFGDEMMTATNFPLVRITNNASGHVFYARTHDHSTMAVGTGQAIVSTNFDVPAETETGASKVEVVANGIPSPSIPIAVN
jgi:hypothetical protein